MTLSEIIDQLTDIQNSLDTDPEVLLATQPNWPLAFTIEDVVEDDEDENIVWIASTGSHPENVNPYSARRAFNQ